MLPSTRTILALAALLALLGCSDEPAPPASAPPDMGALSDAATSTDATSPPVDADTPAEDQGVPDDGPGADQGPGPKQGWDEGAAPLGAGARQETAVVALGGEVYVLGGYVTGANFVDWVEAYDPETDSWRRLADLPARMHHANAAAVGGKLYVLGFLGSRFAADGSGFVYDPQADAWAPVASMPRERRRGASATAAIGDKIYVAGGFRGSAVAEFDVYDPAMDTWTPLPDLPRPLDHGAFGATGDTLVLAGGRDTDVSAVDGRVHLFTPGVDDTWREGSPMPTPRGGLASAMLDGKLYTFGGEGNRDDPAGVFATVEAYDVARDRWEALEGMPTPRHGMGAAALDGAIHVPGGATRQLLAPVDVHEVYRPRAE